jgi:WD40 repeat protein/LysM repeat protein
MSTSNKNPYIGPRTFLKEEGHLFFGREREARDLAALVASQRLVLFYAQSGAGKSSLINTRLIPDLEENHFEVLAVGRVSGDLPPGTEVANIYVYNLMRSLTQHESEPAAIAALSLSQFLGKLGADDQGYFYDADLAELSGGDEATRWRRALIVDQFEEVFSTHPEAWEKREDFFIQLAQAMQADPYLWVVLVMREDYIAALDPYAHLMPGGLRVRYYMQRLGWEAALKAVTSPVERMRPYEKGVAEKLVENLASIKVKRPNGVLELQAGQFVEPVQLQVVCYSLWENLILKGEKPRITEDDLREVGDVNQSLEKFYDARVSAVAKARNVDERQIREWFNTELITTGGIRNMVLQEQNNLSGGLDDRVIQALQGDLVRAEMRAGQIWYELSHDRLIEPILISNAKWFAANLSVFQQQAALWVNQGRPEGMLLRGNELEQAEREAEAKTITRDEVDFLEACKKARQRERRESRANWLARILTIVAIIASIFAVGFAVQSINQKNVAEGAVLTATYSLGEAKEARDNAVSLRAVADSERGINEAEKLAGQAQSAIWQSESVQLGQLLAVEAYKINTRSGEIKSSVYQALFDSMVEKGDDLSLGEKPFLTAAFSPDASQKWLIVDGVLWNLTNKQSSNLVLDSGEIIRSAFQSDEVVTLVTYDYSIYSDNPFRAYTLLAEDQTDTPISLFFPGFQIRNIEISDNGRWLIAYGTNYEGPGAPGSPGSNAGVLIWDVNNPKARPVNFDIAESGTIQNVAMTEDGKILAVTTERNLYLWRDDNKDIYEKTRTLITDAYLTETRFRKGTLKAKSGSGLQISPDGLWLAQLTEDEINLYTTDDTTKVKYTIPVQDVQVSGFLFSPNSQSLIFVTSNFQSCSRGQNCQPSASVSQFPLAGTNPKATEIYQSTTADITVMEIGRNGKMFIGDAAGYIRVWDLTADMSGMQSPQVISAHVGAIADIRVGPDDQTVISASQEDGTRLWKLTESDTDAVKINRISNTASSALRSEDGTLLAVGGINTESSVGNIHIYSNLDLPNEMQDVSFSSDSGSGLGALAISKDWVAAVRTYRPNLNAVPSFYLDFWTRKPENAGSSPISFKLRSEVSSLAFYPDGNYLVVASSTGELGIADTAYLEMQSDKVDPQLAYAKLLTNDLGNIQSLFFTRDGRYLIAGNVNGVRIWDTQKLDAGMYSLSEAFYPVRISPDQEQLIAAGTGNSVQVLDLEKLSYTTISPYDQTPITRLTFNPAGDRLAVVNKSGQISIYQFPMITSSPAPLYTLRGAPGNITWLEFGSAQSKEQWLAASAGYLVYLWNLAKPNERPIMLQGYNGPVVYVGFTNNGEWIVTASGDQTIRFWSLDLEKLRSTACKYAGRNMKLAEWERYFPDRDYDLEHADTCPDLGYELEKRATGGSASTPPPVNTLPFVQPPTSTPRPPDSFVGYIVQPNDTLIGIASRFGLSISTLMEDNDITDAGIIRVGQTLLIRVVSTPIPP